MAEPDEEIAHSEQTPSDGIHVAHAYDVANAGTRMALSVTAADVGKLCLQRDLPALFLLTSAGPPKVWQQLADKGAVDAAVAAVSTKAAGAIQGPAVSVNQALLRSVGEDGKRAQSSPITVDDAGNLSTPGLIDGVDVNALSALVTALLAHPYLVTAMSGTLSNESVLAEGPGIKLTQSGSTLTIECTITQGGGGGGGAPTDAQYLVASASSGLSNELVLAQGPGIKLTQSGSTLTIECTVVPGSGGEGGGPAAPTAAPPPIAAAGAIGAPGSYATEGHTHAHGSQAGGSLHAAASAVAAGFLSAADKQRIDAAATLGDLDPLTSAIGALAQPSYLVRALSGTLSNELVLAEGAGIKLTQSAGTLTVECTVDAGTPPDLSSKADKNLTIVAWASAALTLTAAHANALIRWDGTADAVLTIADDATSGLPSGFTCSLLHRGPIAYKVSYTKPAGVTITNVNPGEAAQTIWQNGMVTFIKDGPNSWIVTGGLKVAA